MKIFFFICIVIMALGVLVTYINSQKVKEINQILDNQLREDEKRRGKPVNKIEIYVNKDDQYKIGYIKNEKYPNLPAYLIKSSDETVHFAYPFTHKLYLTKVIFNPKYNLQTKGSVSGNTGSSILGTALLGTSGGIIGSSGSRRVNTTSKQVEVSTNAVLTFIDAINHKTFSIEISANSDIYNKLIKNFQCSQATLNKITNVDNINTKNSEENKDIVSQLKEYKELLDCGILTKDEFDKKKKQLINLW